MDDLRSRAADLLAALRVYPKDGRLVLDAMEALDAALRSTDVPSAACAHEYIGHGFCGLRPEDHKTEIIGGNHRYQPPRSTDVPSDGLRSPFVCARPDAGSEPTDWQANDAQDGGHSDR